MPNAEQIGAKRGKLATGVKRRGKLSAGFKSGKLASGFVRGKLADIASKILTCFKTTNAAYAYMTNIRDYISPVRLIEIKVRQMPVMIYVKRVDILFNTSDTSTNT